MNLAEFIGEEYKLFLKRDQGRIDSYVNHCLLWLPLFLFLGSFGSAHAQQSAAREAMDASIAGAKIQHFWAECKLLP